MEKTKKKKIAFQIFAIMLIIIFSFAITPVTLQNDTFYTVKIGELIAKNGIDMQDHFSWHENLPYTYPHWGYDLIMYGIYNCFGFAGIYISTVILACILGIAIYIMNCKISKNKNVNLGSHNHLLNIIFGECINKFYLSSFTVVTAVSLFTATAFSPLIATAFSPLTATAFSPLTATSFGPVRATAFVPVFTTEVSPLTATSAFAFTASSAFALTATSAFAFFVTAVLAALVFAAVLRAGFFSCFSCSASFFAASISALVRRFALGLPLKNSTPKRGILILMDCS